MKPILRFKESIQHIEAGSLMALGAQAKPDPGAMQRVARQVGVSSAALAAAQSAAMNAAAEIGTAATATNAAAVGTGAGSVLAASVIKGVAIGLCLSGVAYIGVHLQVTSTSPTPVAAKASAQHTGVKPTDSNAAAVAASPSATPSEEDGVSNHHRISTTPSNAIPFLASAGSSASRPAAAERQMDEARTRTATDAPPPVPQDTPSSRVTVSPAAALATIPSAPAPSADPRVMQEVMSLDRVRALTKQGNAALALRELDYFDQVQGYRLLSSESKLVRIDVLLSLGMRQAAAGIARQLLVAGAPATQRHRLTVLANSGATPETPAKALK